MNDSHGANKQLPLGPLTCGDGVHDRLRLLSDLVRMVRQRDGGRWVSAAEVVVAELERAGAELDLFVRGDNDNHAVSIECFDDRRKATSKRLSGALLRRHGNFATNWGGIHHELGIDDGRGFLRIPSATQDKQSQDGATGEAPGRPVALARLRARWCMPNLMPGALDDPVLSRYAIREGVAQRLFAAEVPALPHELPSVMAPHDRARWGHNVTSEGRPAILLRLLDIVAAASAPGAVTAAGMAWVEALGWVADGLRTCEGVRWFKLSTQHAPALVSDADEWRPWIPSGQATFDDWKTDCGLGLRSAADGLFMPLDEARIRGLKRERHLPSDPGIVLGDDEWLGLAELPPLIGQAGVLPYLDELIRCGAEQEAPQTAVIESLAVPAWALAALPWMTNGADIGGSVAGVCEAAAVQPIGGAWPHAKGAPWSDAERDALFEMRHRCGMTDKEIAAAIELDSAQRISQVIGAKDAHRIKDGSAYPDGLRWRPSRDLLARCDIEAGAKLVRVSKTG